jgi:hypothetical protein
MEAMYKTLFNPIVEQPSPESTSSKNIKLPK